MVQLKQLIAELKLRTFCSKEHFDKPISGGYCGDLLSDVMANARAGEIWITIQTHPNIVAVASLKELGAVLLANGREPSSETLERAENEKVPILGSNLSSFELANTIGGLLQTGLRRT